MHVLKNSVRKVIGLDRESTYSLSFLLPNSDGNDKINNMQIIKRKKIDTDWRQ